MKKVILLGNTPPPIGGIAKWTMRMLNANLEQEWKIDLVDEKMIKREVFGENTQLNYFYEIKRWLKVWLNLIKKLCSKDVKIVHCCPIGTKNSMIAETVNATLARLFRKKVILHFRCTLPNMIKNKDLEKRLCLLCKKADLIIALNTQTKKFLNNLVDTKCVVIPNFIDSNELIQEKILVNDEIKTVLYTGGVTEEKGCMEILEVAKNYKNITFKLVGKASPEVVKNAKKLKNVILTGVKNEKEVLEELHNADVYMFLSHYPGEGFSNSLAEAMAAGLPCIVTDWAANADMVEDKLGGYVVPINDSKAAIDALKLMYDKKVRYKQSKFNLEKASFQYIENKVLKQYINCYESLV